MDRGWCVFITLEWALYQVSRGCQIWTGWERWRRWRRREGGCCFLPNNVYVCICMYVFIMRSLIYGRSYGSILRCYTRLGQATAWSCLSKMEMLEDWSVLLSVGQVRDWVTLKITTNMSPAIYGKKKKNIHSVFGFTEKKWRVIWHQILAHVSLSLCLSESWGYHLN